MKAISYQLNNITSRSAIIVFCFAAYLYFLILCRYQIIYLEQQQLFQYHSDYFNRLMIFPAGMAMYFNNFLFQFFYYPWLGALILASFLLAIYWVISSIIRHFRVSPCFDFFPLFPVAACCLLMAYYKFNLLWILSFLFSLFIFAGYIRISSPLFRYCVGVVGLILSYFFSPSAMFLAAILFITNELLFSHKKKEKYLSSIVYLFITGILPWLAWKTIYTVPLSEAFLNGFPYDETLWPLSLVSLSWLMIPIVLLMIRFHPIVTLKRWMMALAVVTFVCGGLYYSSDKRHDMLFRMNYELTEENWTEILRLSREFPVNNHLTTCYTNIALYKTGQMLSHFFDYIQTGPEGLFLVWRHDFPSAFTASEIFYQMGFTNEANHWAFEALTISKSGENPFLLKRLIQNAIINEDYQVARKYLHMFQSTLFYRNWANDLLSILNDSEQTGNLPWVKEKRSQWVKNDFFSGQIAPANLPMFLDEHPENKMAFEYMMMHHLLTKNLNAFMSLIPRISNYDYSVMPTIFEEAILLYIQLQNDEETYRKYPLKNDTYQRFNNYVQVSDTYSKAPQLQKQNLEKYFRNTYWFYFQFFMPHQ